MKYKYIPKGVLEQKINLLSEYYMPKNLDPEYYKQKNSALKKLQFIINHTDRRSLQDADYYQVLNCSLTLIYFFGMRLKLKKSELMKIHRRFYRRYVHWWGAKEFRKAEQLFIKLIDMLSPELTESTVSITFHFLSKVSLWQFESFVIQILEVILFFNRGMMTLFNMMLTDIHYVVFHDVKSARHRMRVLYNLLKSDNWEIDQQKLLPFITRLLDFFAESAESKGHVYAYLRKGFVVCLRRIFERAENHQRRTIITTMLNWFSLVKMEDGAVMEFLSMLDRVASLYKVGAYSESLIDGLINHILRNLVGSSNTLYSLCGSRLLQRLLDRSGNAESLFTPTIFYDFTQTKLKVGRYDKSDTAFIRRHREKFHMHILNAFHLHSKSCVNLTVMFFVICCLVLEVPCGLTAATAASMVMSVQDLAINGENITPTCRYWMHSIVVSVMSLICWVHKSPVLYTYVNQIISRRAKEAPQLNPPLLLNYNLGLSIVTWNKPSLFFEDWELRYALWKHFQDEKIKKELKKHGRSMSNGHTVLLPSAKYFKGKLKGSLEKIPPPPVPKI